MGYCVYTCVDTYLWERNYTQCVNMCVTLFKKHQVLIRNNEAYRVLDAGRYCPYLDNKWYEAALVSYIWLHGTSTWLVRKNDVPSKGCMFYSALCFHPILYETSLSIGMYVVSLCEAFVLPDLLGGAYSRYSIVVALIWWHTSSLHLCEWLLYLSFFGYLPLIYMYWI